jgi:hypothetical protein
VTYSGLMARSARSRILRAISVSSPGASTSLDASSQTSRCADLISLAMMSMASSLGGRFRGDGLLGCAIRLIASNAARCVADAAAAITLSRGMQGPRCALRRLAREHPSA